MKMKSFLLTGDLVKVGDTTGTVMCVVKGKALIHERNGRCAWHSTDGIRLVIPQIGDELL